MLVTLRFLSHVYLAAELQSSAPTACSKGPLVSPVDTLNSSGFLSPSVATPCTKLPSRSQPGSCLFAHLHSTSAVANLCLIHLPNFPNLLPSFTLPTLVQLYFPPISPGSVSLHAYQRILPTLLVPHHPMPATNSTFQLLLQHCFLPPSLGSDGPGCP